MTAPAPTKPILHSYWRSSAAYRVRIALALKAVDYVQVAHDLRLGEQSAPEYSAIAPHQLVPTLQADGLTLIESPAILEWMESRWPQPPLLPESPQDAAVVRAMAAIIACDIHPLNNLRVLNRLRHDFDANEAQITAWAQQGIAQGFAALEHLITDYGGSYAFGNTPTWADCLLVPQVYSAKRFHLDLSPYPRLAACAHHAAQHPAFRAAHPDNQPDADPA